MQIPYHQVQLAREHERTRRQVAEARRELAMLRRGELWHPLTRREYRALLRANLVELESTLEEIEQEWDG